MRSSTIEVVLDVRFQNIAQVTLAEDDHVVEALPAYGAKEALIDGIQIGSARGNWHNIDAAALGHVRELASKLAIVRLTDGPEAIGRLIHVPGTVWQALTEVQASPG